MAGAKDGAASIVIRKEEIIEGGHHGGAWKVAYADFVTAMMAFFLLMWLLNATTEEQRRGIADYFSPHNGMSNSTSGFGLPFGGRTPNSTGALASDRGAVQIISAPYPLDQMDDDDPAESPRGAPPARDAEDREPPPGTLPRETRGDQPASGASLGEPAAFRPGAARPESNPPPKAAAGRSAPDDKALQQEVEKREQSAFAGAAQQIRDAIRSDPALADLARQLVIDITPEGLRVQLTDEERQPMFATGSAALNERARAVLGKIAAVLQRLPEQVSITGHTDSAPYRGADRTNWDLSADRANATRRLLVEAGLPEGRIRSVAGMADHDPLVTDNRLAAANRRIAIVVLRDKPAGP